MLARGQEAGQEVARLRHLALAIRRLKLLEEMERLEGSLIDFVEAAWPWVDSSEYKSSWAVEAICEHLEAVTNQQFRRLLINIPPRSSKTTLCSIMWPVWTWARSQRTFLSGPGVRFLCGSYGGALSLINATTARRLIFSPWFQERWGRNAVVITEDQKAKGKFDTSAGGTRISSSVGGSILGIGYDAAVIDDPHNLEGAESDADRETVRSWWREVSSTRMNDPKRSALVVVMQRLHEQDISGVILGGEDVGDWEHLMIPMRHDEGRHCVTSIWQDPRTSPGELMWPERFGEHEVAGLERDLGPYFSSGRLQQAPTPDKGGIFDRTWWQLYESPDGKFPPLDYVVASLDGAFTEKEENDPSGLTVWGAFRNQDGKRRIIMLHAWRKHLKFSAVRVEQLPRESPEAYRRRTMADWGLMEWLNDTCNRFKVDRLLIEAKASGISAAQELQNRYGEKDWGIQLMPVKGDKIARALAVQPTFSQLLVYAPARDWAEMVIDEMAVFPKGRYDDLTDSATQAMKYLRENGLALTDEEAERQERRNVEHRPKPKPIYPV